MRWVLLLAGSALLVWMPLSGFYRLHVVSSWPFAQTYLIIGDSVIYLNISREMPWQVQRGVSVRFEPIAARMFDHWWFPSYDAERDVEWTNDEFFIPIWLASAMCLAWPVTSLIVAQRKHRLRGFEVKSAESVKPLPAEAAP